MKSKIHTYEKDDLVIRYDVNRCIHAAECVKGLQQVFDPQKRPWIQPEHADAESIISIVQRCPTGALHTALKSESDTEAPPPRNTISIVPDGPVYIRGNIELQDADGEVLLKDTRMAVCRCGQSANKPLCDNSHLEDDFTAAAAFESDSLQEDITAEADGKLILKALENGPILVQGSYQIYSDVTQPVNCSKNVALCRCGGSSNKPFCDGTHKEIGFRG